MTTNGEEGVTLAPANPTPASIAGDLQAQARRDALAKAVAKLGAEGYEMISPDARNDALLAISPRLAGAQAEAVTTVSSQPFLLYFKRISL